MLLGDYQQGAVLYADVRIALCELVGYTERKGRGESHAIDLVLRSLD